MVKKPFFGLTKPRLKYPVIKKHEPEAIRDIPLPQKITLFVKYPNIEAHDLVLKVGENVVTGQKLKLGLEDEGYLISTATGTISKISEYTGYFGQSCPAISIDTTQEDKWDEEFSKVAEEPPGPEKALQYLNYLPGYPDFPSLLNYKAPVNTIIINGIDKDLLITTNQLMVQNETEMLKVGIEHLKKITRTNRVIIAVSPDLSSLASKTGAEVKTVNTVYPNALPEMIMKNVLDIDILPGKSCEEMGVGFIKAEAVVALSSAFSKGKMPVSKVLSVVDKECNTVSVRARIGTHVKDILDSLDIETGYGDRLVIGGPMTGHAIYSEDMPVLSDCDAVLVQDNKDIVLNSDNQCINCGECVRACPAKIPVNMLVRLLENGLYEEAAERYDLLSCVECGLCSYVCIARIPVFHYIMLGKYEFARIESAEETNA